MIMKNGSSLHFSLLMFRSLICLEAKTLLHYQYLPWHKIAAAIKRDICKCFIWEIIPPLEKRCQIIKEAGFFGTPPYLLYNDNKRAIKYTVILTNEIKLRLVISDEVVEPL